MEIFEALNNNFDNPDLTEYIKPGCYDVYFNDGDSTQFDIYPGQTLNDLMDLWNAFADENGINAKSVDSVSFADPDDEMKNAIADIKTNGLVIIRDVNDDDADRGNTYLSPDDVLAVENALKVCKGKEICKNFLPCETGLIKSNRDFMAVAEEYERLVNARNDAGSLMYEAIKNVQKKDKVSQTQTERGLLVIEAAYQSAERAQMDGYSFAFHSSMLGKDLYSKCLDDRGFKHTFAVIEGYN